MGKIIQVEECDDCYGTGTQADGYYEPIFVDGEYKQVFTQTGTRKCGTCLGIGFVKHNPK